MPAAAQTSEGEELEYIRARQRADLLVLQEKIGKSFSSQEGSDPINALLSTTPAALYAAAAAGPVSYGKMSSQKFWAEFDTKFDEIYRLHEEIASGLRAQGKTVYPAAKLGADNVQFLNEVLRRSIKADGVRVPEVFPLDIRKEWKNLYSQRKGDVLGYLERRLGKNDLVYYVKEGMEKPFRQELLRLFRRHNHINEATSMLTREGYDAFVSRLFAENVSDRMAETVARALLDAEPGSVLRQCVEGMTVDEAYRRIMRQSRTFVIFGEKVVLKKGPLAVLAVATGGVLLWPNEAEGKTLSRIEQNPSLLLNLSDEDFSFVSASQVLRKKYIQISERLHRLASFPAEDLQAVLQNVEMLEHGQKIQVRGRLVPDLLRELAR